MDGFQIGRKRIVITGVGVVSSAGRTVDEFWQSLTNTGSDRESTLEDNQLDKATVAGEAKFTGHIDEFGDLPKNKRKSIRKALKLMNRETQMGVAAGQQALADSGVLERYDPERFGVCFGADNVSVMAEDFRRGIQACSAQEGEFDPDRWGVDGISEVAPLWLLKCLPNMPTCHLAIFNDLRGPSNTITQRDVSANMAIAEACRNIRGGETDAVLVGATGTTLAPFNQMHARLEDEVSDSAGVCRPFDKRRVGTIPGEGAGAFVLEEMESALRRGAHVYGEVLGTASASAVGQGRVAGCRKALGSAIRQVLHRSGQSADSIGHLSAHGLGTRDSDVAEAQAICDVFGRAASRTPVVAAKSHLANAAAGAGALELIASLLALENGHLFPVLNFSEPDPECCVRPVTSCQEAAGTSFLNINMFGRGLASCVAIGAFCA
jgi:3-oxoacyl-[acyl-carrier-protein] synthase II